MISWDSFTSPVSLATVKGMLGILQDDYDEVLADVHIPAAVEWAEGVTRRSIVARTHRWSFKQFPWPDMHDYSSSFKLPRGKTQSVESITYSYGGATTTLYGPSSSTPGTDWREDLGGDNGAILSPAYGRVWPITDWTDPQPVLVTFTAGWTSSQLPAQFVHAIARYCGDALAVAGATDITASTDLGAKDMLLMPWRLECA